MQPVRAQDEVVAVADAVAERDGDAFVVDGHRLRAVSPPDRHVADSGEQHLMQLCPMQRQAGADTVPHVGRLDVEEQASAVVGDALPLNAHRELGHLCAKPETVEGTYRVAGQVDPGALAHRRGGAFDDLDRRAPTAQRASRRQPGNAGADDEHSNTVTPHVPLHCLRSARPRSPDHRVSTGRRTTSHARTPGGQTAAGLMLALWWNTLPGSYFALIRANRSYFAGP